MFQAGGRSETGRPLRVTETSAPHAATATKQAAIPPSHPLLIAGYASFCCGASSSTRTRTSAVMSLYKVTVTVCGPSVSIGL